MHGEPVRIFNRYTGAYEDEAIYGEAALRFAYETAAGRALTALFVARPFLSRFYGWLMDRPSSVRRIRPFIEKYGINEEEFADEVAHFGTFNEFFRRELKPACRPIDPDPKSIVFPADGRHFGWRELGRETGVFVKGQRWNLEALLGGDRDLARRYRNGSLVLSRLCPLDYHHFHYPVAGRVGEARPIGGRLYSVNPVSLRQRLGYLWENRRFLTRIETADMGDVLMIEVGATNVGSIRHRPLPADGRVEKGAPRGWFEFGGSSLVCLFEPGSVRLSDDLIGKTAEGIELYAHFGDRMGVVVK